MILGGQLLLDDGRGRCELAAGYVRVDGEAIGEVVPGEIPETADFGGPHALIAPGFIDAHLHLPQFDMIGAHGLPLLRWLCEVTFPSEMKWEDTDFAASMTRRAIQQLVSKGTTGIGAFATVHHDSAQAALEVARDLGIRGAIGQVLMDRHAPKELCRGADQLLDEAAELGDRFPAGGRMAAAVTPRFAVSCSEELLVGAGHLAEEQNAMIQSHLAETAAECELVEDQFQGSSYVEVYRRAKLLTPRSIFGHGIHLDDRDRRALRDSEATIAHCPTANSFLRSGTMNRQAILGDAIPMAVGSDVGAGYERSMVRVARSMIEAAASLGEGYPDAAQAWHAITAGNADAMGWPDAGRLQPGAAADLVVIQPTIPWLQGNADPLAMLMFAWDDRWLQATMLRGQVAHS